MGFENQELRSHATTATTGCALFWLEARQFWCFQHANLTSVFWVRNGTHEPLPLEHKRWISKMWFSTNMYLGQNHGPVFRVEDRSHLSTTMLTLKTGGQRTLVKRYSHVIILRSCGSQFRNGKLGKGKVDRTCEHESIKQWKYWPSMEKKQTETIAARPLKV